MRSCLFAVLLLAFLVPVACDLVESVGIGSSNSDPEYVSVGDEIVIVINLNDTLKALTGNVHGETDLIIEGDSCASNTQTEEMCACQGSGCSCSVMITRPDNAIAGEIMTKFVQTDIDDLIDAANVTFSASPDLWSLCRDSSSYCDRGNFTCTQHDYRDHNLNSAGDSTTIHIQGSSSMTTACQSSNGYHLEGYVIHDICWELASSIDVTVTVTDAMAEGMVEFDLDFVNGGDMSGMITNSTDGSYRIVDKTPPEVTSLTVSSSNPVDSSLAIPGDIVTYNITVNEDLSTVARAVSLSDGSGEHYFSTCCGTSGSWTNDGWNYVLEVTASDSDTEGSDFILTIIDRAGNEVDITATTDSSSVMYIPSRYVEVSTDLFDGAYTRGAIIFTFESNDPLFEHSDLDYNTTICQNALFQGSFPEWTLRCDANHGYTITIDMIDNANGTGEILFEQENFPYEIHFDDNKQDYVDFCICNSTVFEDCACGVEFPIDPDFIVHDARLSAVAFFPQNSRGNFVVGTSSDGHDTYSECFDSSCSGSGTINCFTNSDVTQYVPFGSVGVVFRHDNDDDGELYINYVLHLELTEMPGQCDNACAEGAVCRATTTGPHCECPYWYNSTNPYAGGPACTMNECGEDDEDFVDDDGNTCEYYRENGCSDKDFLDVDGYFEVLAHCPQACDSCPDPDGAKVRLFGGTESSGILQVWANGQWRTSDGSNGNHDDVQEVCRHLGYSRGFTAEDANPEPSHLPEWTRMVQYSRMYCEGEFDSLGQCFSMCDETDEIIDYERYPDGGPLYVWCINECVEDEGPSIFYDDRSDQAVYDVVGPTTWINRGAYGPIFNDYFGDHTSGNDYEGPIGLLASGQPTRPASEFDLEEYHDDWFDDSCPCDGAGCDMYQSQSSCGHLPGKTFSALILDTGEVHDFEVHSWESAYGNGFSYTRTRKLSCL